MAIDRDLPELLACPKCKGKVHLNPPKDGLICELCRLLYPVRDGIPMMLAEEAVILR